MHISFIYNIETFFIYFLILRHKDGSVLPARETIAMTFDGDKGVAELTFKTLRMADTGVYECVAKNDAGEAKTSTSIAVRSKKYYLDF